MASANKYNLQKELDRVFSLAVRRHYADSEGIVKCVTCPTWKHYSQMTCGHYRKRRHMTTRWLMKNCAPQCETCNGERQGADAAFEIWLNETYGAGTVDELIQLSNREKHFTALDIKAMIHKFSGMLIT